VSDDGPVSVPLPRLLAACAVVLMVAPHVAGQDCPYPLGDFIAQGDFHAYPAGSDDPEFQIVDAVRVRPQYSFGQMGYDGDTLHFAYESEAAYFPLNSTVKSETHIIAYKQYSQTTGWNVTREWISSEDPAVKVPPGGHTQPTLSVSGEDVWVAWQVSGWTIGGEWWPQFGNFIVYRAKVAGQWGPVEALSPLASGTSSRLAKSVPLEAGAYVAYQTNDGEAEGLSFRVVGRTVGPSGLGPVEDISVEGDLWSDETVQLVADGDRIVAVWAARNTTEFLGEGEWRVMVAVRDASGNWGAPVAVSDESKVAAANPNAAFYGGNLFVAWSTDDPEISAGGDRSIVLREVDVQAGELGEVLVVAGSNYPGYEDQPALIEWEGKLHLLWASRSSLEFPGNVTSDTDTHWRTWDGADFSPVLLVSDPDDRSFDEFNPAFLVVDGALHATFITNINTPETGKVHDQRQMTRLLVRGARAYDHIRAEYTLDRASFLGDGTVNLTVSFFGKDSQALVSDHFGLVLADGTILQLPPGRSTAQVELPFEANSFAPPANATWCGKPLPLSWHQAESEGPGGAPAWAFLVGGLVPLLAVLGAVLVVRHRRKRRPASEGPSK
jgi:hypothetical protein